MTFSTVILYFCLYDSAISVIKWMYDKAVVYNFTVKNPSVDTYPKYGPQKITLFLILNAISFHLLHKFFYGFTKGFIRE